MIWELDGDISWLLASIETPARKLLLMSVLTKDAKLLHTRLYLNKYALGKVVTSHGIDETSRNYVHRLH